MSGLVQQASAPDANLSALCVQFGISRPTGYKWLARYQEGGLASLADQSRRPRTQPTQTDAACEQQALALRTEHPAWGGRKLRARLQALSPRDPVTTERPVPSASTITAILRTRLPASPPPLAPAQRGVVQWRWLRRRSLGARSAAARENPEGMERIWQVKPGQRPM